MGLRFSRLCHTGAAILVAATLAALPTVGLAQDDPRVVPPKDSKKKLPEAPAKLPKVGSDRTKGLDFLFGALKAAPDEASARHVEARIWAQWMQTPSDINSAAVSLGVCIHCAQIRASTWRAKQAMDAQKAD